MKINRFVLTIMLVIITAVFVFLFLIPKYNELGSLQNNLAQKQAEYNSKSAYYGKIAEVIKQIDLKQPSLSKIDSALPSDFHLSSVIYFLQQKAISYGLDLNSITSSQVSQSLDGAGVKNVTFDVHFNGTYTGFKNFLSSLDTSARLFEVNSISFNSAISVASAGRGGKGLGAATSGVDSGSNFSSSADQAYNFSIEIQTHTY